LEILLLSSAYQLNLPIIIRLPNYQRRPFNRPYDKDRFIRYRRNEQIRLSPVRVIGEEGEQIGIIPTAQALLMAREEGLDLVEVAPNVRPPVCRIMEWSKFKYELSKKQKGQKKKTEETKEMRFGALIGKGDMEHKLKRVCEFLDEGNSVKLTVRTPRRVDIKLSEELMRKLLEILNSKLGIAIIQPARREGFYVTSLVKTEKSIKKKAAKPIITIDKEANGETEGKKNSDEKVPRNQDRKDSPSKKRLEPSSK